MGQAHRRKQYAWLGSAGSAVRARWVLRTACSSKRPHADALAWMASAAECAEPSSTCRVCGRSFGAGDRSELGVCQVCGSHEVSRGATTGDGALRAQHPATPTIPAMGEAWPLLAAAATSIDHLNGIIEGITQDNTLDGLPDVEVPAEEFFARKKVLVKTISDLGPWAAV